MVDLAAESGK